MIQRIPHYLSNMVEAVLWACMAASGTGPLFVDDLTADRSVQGYMLRFSQMLQKQPKCFLRFSSVAKLFN